MWRNKPTKAAIYRALSDAVNLHVKDGTNYRMPEELRRKLAGPSSPAIYGHLPYNFFMTRVVQLCGPGVCVELGTQHGAGARHMAAGDAKTEVWTIDFDPYGKSHLEEWPNIHFIQSLTSDAVEQVQSPIDLLFIDAEHTYDAVMRDFRLYSPKLGDPSLVLFDDLYHNCDVAAVWAELGLDGFVSPCLHYTGFGVAYIGKWEDGDPVVVASMPEYGKVLEHYDRVRREQGFPGREDD